MKFNPKVTGGLAWAGLILILAVPSADMLTKPQGGSANSVTSDMDAIRTASVDATTAPKAPRSVAAEEDRFAAGSDAYPSYIVDVPEGAPKKPATTFKLTAPGAQPTRSATDVASVTAEPEAAPVQ